MPDTVRETIVSTIATELEDLVLGSGSQLTVQDVFRDWHQPENEGVYPYIVVLDPREEKVTGKDGAPLRHYRVSLFIEVWIVVDVANLRDDPASKTLNEAVGNASRKLYEESVPDGGALKSISGFNWLHDLGNEEFDFEEASVQAVRADFEIQYIHRDTSPFLGRA